MLDDRSTAEDLVRSMLNAVALRDYVRAYSYWQEGALPPIDEYAAGYADSEAIAIATGEVSAQPTAGHMYFTVPVTLSAQHTDRSMTMYQGQYVVVQVQPGVFGAPPFEGMVIDSGTLHEVPFDDSAAVSDASRPTLPVHASIDVNHFIDDRTDAVTVLQSLYNAVNRGEYVRAYSYWEPTAGGLPPFETFRAGYQQTAAVALLTGDVGEDHGLGHVYDAVPVVLKVTATTGDTQTFSGCYGLLEAAPGSQTTPPFVPLQIGKATLAQVSGDAANDPGALLGGACP
jgi:hypothetical protein